jgi:hypothetical protein
LNATAPVVLIAHVMRVVTTTSHRLPRAIGRQLFTSGTISVSWLLHTPIISHRSVEVMTY